jgi:hypothetical protein
MRELQILILDLLGNEIGELDLTDSDDFALKLTKSIASINNLGKRNTSFSLDFEAPQTKNNNKLLAGLRFATASKEILGQKPCSIIVDGNQVDRGFLYAFESTVDGMYTLNFKGLNNDWVERLRDVELNELNWRDWVTGLRTEDATEEFSGVRIGVLNAQNSVTSDLIYPAINRNNGGYSGDLRPQIHLRSIVLAMFEKIGYTVSSVFLDSDWVKGLNPPATNYTDAYGYPYEHLGLSVDPAFQMTRDQQDLIGQAIEYKSAGITTSLDPTTWAANLMVGNLGTPSAINQRNTYRFPNLINTIVTDINSRFDPVTSEFTVGTGGTFTLKFTFKYEYAYFDNTLPVPNWLHYGLPSSPGQHPPSFKWYIVKNNTSDTVVNGTIIYQGSTPVPSNIQQITGGSHSFASGDKISVFLEILEGTAVGQGYAYLDTAPNLQYWRLRIANDSVLEIVPIADVQLGDTFRINSHIPNGIKCMSLLQDFKTMFNLYFDVDVNRKVVFIEPRDDFFTGQTLDITDKIDLNTQPTLNYLTDYKNEMVFSYATDSNDKYLEQWNKVNYKTYGEEKYYLGGNNERFEKGQSILSTQLLSASIQEEVENQENIITSIIKEEYLAADNVGKPVNKNYGARVFQLIKGRQRTPAGVVRRTSSPFIVLVAAMEDYANTPTFEDRRLTFNATKGLVEEYYAKTLANIEDTVVLTLKINLSLYDFNSWDLSRSYYISEPAEIAGYYITDSIKNFNVTKETPTTITLVKFKDFVPVAITQGVGNVNVITQNSPQPQEIFVTVNGAIVSCLDNNLNKMYKL